MQPVVSTLVKRAGRILAARARVERGRSPAPAHVGRCVTVAAARRRAHRRTDAVARDISRERPPCTAPGMRLSPCARCDRGPAGGRIAGRKPGALRTNKPQAAPRLHSARAPRRAALDPDRPASLPRLGHLCSAKPGPRRPIVRIHAGFAPAAQTPAALEAPPSPPFPRSSAGLAVGRPLAAGGWAARAAAACSTSMGVRPVAESTCTCRPGQSSLYQGAIATRKDRQCASSDPKK